MFTISSEGARQDPSSIMNVQISRPPRAVILVMLHRLASPLFGPTAFALKIGMSRTLLRVASKCSLGQVLQTCLWRLRNTSSYCPVSSAVRACEHLASAPRCAEVSAWLCSHLIQCGLRKAIGPGTVLSNWCAMRPIKPEAAERKELKEPVAAVAPSSLTCCYLRLRGAGL